MMSTTQTFPFGGSYVSGRNPMTTAEATPAARELPCSAATVRRPSAGPPPWPLHRHGEPSRRSRRRLDPHRERLVPHGLTARGHAPGTLATLSRPASLRVGDSPGQPGPSVQALVASDILVFRVDSHAELQIRSLSCGFDVVSCALEVLCLSCHCHFSGAGPGIHEIWISRTALARDILYNRPARHPHHRRERNRGWPSFADVRRHGDDSSGCVWIQSCCPRASFVTTVG